MFYLLLLIIALVVWVDLVPLIKDQGQNANTNDSDDMGNENKQIKNNTSTNKKTFYVTASFLSLSLIISAITYYELLVITTLGVFLNDIFKYLLPAFYDLMKI